HNQHRQSQRDRQQHADHELENKANQAADIARGQPEHHAEYAAEERRAEPHRERDTSAIDDATIDVASHGIGAKRVAMSWWQERDHRIGGGWGISRNKVGEHRSEDKHQHNAGAGSAERM